MRSLFVAICAASLLIAAPALSKAKKHVSSEKGSGVYCWAGADSAYFPRTRFPERIQNKLRKGMTIKINLSGYGPANCRVY